MRNKLTQRGYGQELIAGIIEQLKSDNYLSEYRFAESYLRSRINSGEAPWLAGKRAKQKGVDHHVLSTVMGGMESSFDEEGACRKLLEQRDPGGLRFEDERVWRRQARFLRNKGYNSDTILRVLKERSN